MLPRIAFLCQLPWRNVSARPASLLVVLSLWGLVWLGSPGVSSQAVSQEAPRKTTTATSAPAAPSTENPGKPNRQTTQAEKKEKPDRSTPPASGEATGRLAGTRLTGPERMITPEREAAAFKFAELHHPELQELLKTLKRSARQQYAIAILEIHRASERLARMQENSPERYELELELWKVGSRLKLLMASLSVADETTGLLSQARALLERKRDLEEELIAWEIERTSRRLERLEQTRDTLVGNRQEALERQLERLARMAKPPATNPRDKRDTKVGTPAPATNSPE